MREFMLKKQVEGFNFIKRMGENASNKLKDNKGSGFMDTVVKILITLVLGGLVLGALYALFGDVIMPKIESKIDEMFNFKG